MEQFLEALSDFAQGCVFGDKEDPIVRDVFLYITRKWIFASMDTLTPVDLLPFAVVRERGEMLYKRISQGLPKSTRNRFKQDWQNSTTGQQAGYIKRQPVNESKRQRCDECHNCGISLKPNHQENCPARTLFVTVAGVADTSQNNARKRG